MRTSRWFCLFIVLGVAAMSGAGDIQVSCEPGLRVYLDDELMGTSSAKEDGLYLMDVANGKHTIRVKKDGFIPQSFEVEVASLPIEIAVTDFVPIPILNQQKAPATSTASSSASKVTQLVGHLVVTSAPQNCVVEIDGRVETKDTPFLSIGGLAVGEHKISFTKVGYAPISGVVTIMPGVEITVRGNFKEGKVEVVHEGKGSLRVTSNPQRCTIRFAGEVIEKTRMWEKRTHIPAGEHLMIVTIPGRTMSRNILILDGQRTTVELSFVKGNVDFIVTYAPE